MVGEVDVADGEAGQIVDFLLRKNPFAVVLAGSEVAAAVLDHGRPLQGHGFREFVGSCGFRGLRGILGKLLQRMR